MDNNERMNSYYAELLEKMTGKKVVLMGDDVLNKDGFIENWDFEVIKNGKYFVAKKLPLRINLK